MLLVDRKYSLSAIRLVPLQLRQGGDWLLLSVERVLAVDGDKDVSEDGDVEPAEGEVENKDTLRSFSISIPPPECCCCCCCCLRFFASAWSKCSNESPRCWRKNMKAFETTNANLVFFTAGIEMCTLFAYRIEIIPTKHQALCISFGHHGSTSSLIRQEGHFP